MTAIEGLLLAVAVEGPVVLGIGLRAQGRAAWATWLSLVVGANLVTYFPFLAAASALRSRWGDPATLSALEAAVALVEGGIYAWAGGLGWRRGLSVSAVANLLSFGAGVLATRGP